MNSKTPGTSNPGVNLQGTSHKKRSHTATHDSGRKFNFSRAPPLPQLKGDLLLQVYTHKSLRRKDTTPDQFEDNERLIEIGKAAFDFVLTRYLFRKRPMLKAQDIALQRTLLISSGMVEDWVRHYGLMRRVVCHPDLVKTLESNSAELLSIFLAYVGGVFQSYGPEAVHCWIDPLLSQEPLIQPETAVKPDPHPTATKRPKNETLSPPLNFFKKQPLPPLPARTNPLAPAQPDAAFLPLFNMEAAKRRVTVEYLWEFSGQSHAGRWKAKCIVNGICKGEGSSSHKQAAKEEAARNAFDNMGWR